MTRPMKAPRVTVVMATFNDGKYLYDSISSVLRQSYRNLELIIVDDGSTDTTAQVISHFSTIDDRLIALQLPYNSGRPAVPRNVGLRHARGELIAFLDADDVWRKHKLRRQVYVFEQLREASIVHSGMWVGRYFRDVKGLRHLYLNRRRIVSASSLRSGNLVIFSSAVVKTDVLRALGGFDEDPRLRAVEDRDLWIRAADAGCRFVYIEEVHGLYRQRRDSISRGQTTSQEGFAQKPQVVNRFAYLRKVLKRLLDLPVTFLQFSIIGETKYRLTGRNPVNVP